MAKDTVVHRFAGSFKELAPIVGEAGTVWSNKGYTATSACKALIDASEFYGEESRTVGSMILDIRIPSGAHAAYLPAGMSTANPKFGLGEILLPRGSKFRTLSIDKQRGRAQVELVTA